MFSRQKLTAANVFIFSENKSNCGKCLATVAGSFAWHFKPHGLLLSQVTPNGCCLFYFVSFRWPSDMLSPSADTEEPMEYDASDKSSMDDSDEACSIPGSFSPDNNQDGISGDQRYYG